jgi:hypothetical protein
MTELTSPLGLSIKIAFQEALEEYRSGFPVLPTVSSSDPNYKQAFTTNITLAREKVNNVVLAYMYLYGQAMYDNDEAPIRTNRHQLASNFLFQYFREEPEAIPHLRNVAPNSLTTLSTRERKAIIRERPTPATIIDLEDPTLWLPLGDEEDPVILLDDPSSPMGYPSIEDLFGDYPEVQQPPVSHKHPLDDSDLPQPPSKRQRRSERDPRD